MSKYVMCEELPTNTFTSTFVNIKNKAVVIEANASSKFTEVEVHFPVQIYLGKTFK